jgi:hypothetical protein
MAHYSPKALMPQQALLPGERRVAIMQPYLFPYIGYFQLIAAVDLFIVYDNIKYTKKGWINRNRLLHNGTDAVFSVPLKKASDALYVCERDIADNFNPDKLLNQFAGAYRRAPCFSSGFALLEQVLRYPERNLFGFLHHALLRTCQHLGITTEIRTSSQFPIDHGLKAQDKVLALCEASEATTYINAIGGQELYSRDAFARQDVQLHFLRAKPFEYPQLGNAFVPWLSIVDVLMFNPLETIQQSLLSHYELV